MDIENISRRSFLKKTTVLTVGVASMTLFSGLVNAADVNGYYHREETCKSASIDEQARYLDTELSNGHNQCWTHVKCNGVDYYTGHGQCPSATENYQEWYSCVQQECKRIPDDWPLCRMALGIQ